MGFSVVGEDVAMIQTNFSNLSGREHILKLPYGQMFGIAAKTLTLWSSKHLVLAGITTTQPKCHSGGGLSFT